MNLGAWRLRNVSSMQYDQQRRHWDTQSTWLQRDVRSLKSLLRIGDTYTTGDVFDSIPFRGVQLMSDDEMLPDSQRGFAPTIRGVAHSNAKVTVSQHGYVIYETFVSPGAFAISDLYPTSQSGDLEVKVTESNGSVRTFTQPYSRSSFLCCAKGAANSALAPGATIRGGYRPLAGIPAGNPVLRSVGGIYSLWRYATGPGLSVLGAGPGARFRRVRVAGRRRDPGRHPHAVGRALRGPFAACPVSERFCQLGDLIQPRQLPLLLQRLLRFCRSQRAGKRAGAGGQPASPGRAIGDTKPWRPRQSGDLRLVAGLLAPAEPG